MVKKRRRYRKKSRMRNNLSLVIMIANLPLRLIKGEALEGNKRADHVYFADPLGLVSAVGSDSVVDVEA